MSQVVISPEGGTSITIVAQAPRPIVIQRPGVQGVKGLKGDQGNAGWSPVLANVEDGERRVQQIADWTGGEGTPPEAGSYIGPSGLVTDIGDATDIRGAPGAGDMLASVYDPQGIEADAFARSNHTGTQTLATISDAGTMAAEAAADYTKTAGLAAVALSGAYSDLSGAPSLATVATTGAYADLSGKPTLGDAAALDVGATAGTVAEGDHTHADATTSAPGFMSAEDKTKLDALDASPPIVILVMGQSNAQITRDYPTYSPPSNAFLWNYDGYPTTGTVGTAFDPLETDKMSWGRSIAIEHARDNPLRKVYVINIAWGGAAIDQWLVGASSPDMWAELTNNITPALAAAGVSKIDYFYWRQGETEALIGGVASRFGYLYKFENMIARLRGTSWFPWATPIVVSEYSPYGAGSALNVGNYGQFNQYVLGSDPALRSLAIFKNTPSTDWEPESPVTNIHNTAEGYRRTGIIAYNAMVRGRGSPRADGFFGELIKRVAEGRASNTTLDSASWDQELYVPLNIGYSYDTEWDLNFLVFDGAAGLRFGLIGPSVGHIDYRYEVRSDSGSTIYQGGSDGIAFPANYTYVGTGFINVRLKLHIRSPTTSGAVVLGWAQAVSSATLTVLNSGSSVRASRWKSA